MLDQEDFYSSSGYISGNTFKMCIDNNLSGIYLSPSVEEIKIKKIIVIPLDEVRE